MWFKVFLIALSILNYTDCHEEPNNQREPSRLLVITYDDGVYQDAFYRFNTSVFAYGLDIIVLKPRLSNPEKKSTHERFEEIKKAVFAYRLEQDLMLLVADYQNTLINGNKEDILTRFKKLNQKTKIVFSADATCQPNAEFESKFPEPNFGGDKFINSKVFIGYAPNIWEMLNSSCHGKECEDFQMLATKFYLDKDIRQKLGIEVDHRAELIQNLNKAENDIELDYNHEFVRIKNVAYNTEPLIIHGSGDSQMLLNSMGNYLGKSWSPTLGCLSCNKSQISLSSIKENELPSVLIGLFIEEPTPFLDEFFIGMYKLNYPKNKLHLFIHNSIEYHDDQVDKFIQLYGDEYSSKDLYSSSQEQLKEWQARSRSLDRCLKLQCDFYLSLDSVARLDNPNSLRHLIEANKNIVAPMLTRPNKLWSNFWGSLTPDGYYARSHDYVDIVKREKVGIWNVPHIMNAYLIEGKFIESLANDSDFSEQNALPRLSYQDPSSELKPVLEFSRSLRSSGKFLYVMNSHEFGHLVDPSNYNISLTNPDFYQLIDNMKDWEKSYLHANYSNTLDDETKLEQPCQDVFWFPVVNDKFCNQIIEIMESYGQWSGGTNEDPRIEGGYESVPTRDIHLKQVGLHEMWLTFLRDYVMPIQLKEYIGYEHDPPRAELAFVVRYHPAEQPSLRPHHDASTYTLNIALNSPGVDYEGGGCRFVRYNCSVVESRKGWALMHPGRLTHYHEGLPVTNGTRYIMVTFVDP